VTIKFLDYNDVVKIHDRLIEKYGGTLGVYDAKLKSALAEPMAGVRGVYFYPDVFSMAAAYFFHIIGSHAFVDGTKRTGTMVAIAFLGLNGHPIRKVSKRLNQLADDLADVVHRKRVSKEIIACELRVLADKAKPKPLKPRPKRKPSRRAR
jgi:death-on-curing family protein